MLDAKPLHPCLSLYLSVPVVLPKSSNVFLVKVTNVSRVLFCVGTCKYKITATNIEGIATSENEYCSLMNKLFDNRV